MNIDIESLTRAITEMDQLILGYYADTNAQDGIPPLAMQWQFYADLEKQHRLVIFTARENEELIGFNMYIIQMHPQHADMMCAFCNTLGVATKHRSKGVGTALAQAAEAYFKECTAVKMIVHGSRAIYDTTPLFEKLGFTLSERIYVKVL